MLDISKNHVQFSTDVTIKQSLTHDTRTLQYDLTACQFECHVCMTTYGNKAFDVSYTNPTLALSVSCYESVSFMILRFHVANIQSNSICIHLLN